MTVNFWTSSCDSLDTEKARLLMADRLRSSRILLISFSSERASFGVTTFSLGERPFSYDFVSLVDLG
jgi:hypothetical protein